MNSNTKAYPLRLKNGNNKRKCRYRSKNEYGTRQKHVRILTWPQDMLNKTPPKLKEDNYLLSSYITKKHQVYIFLIFLSLNCRINWIKFYYQNYLRTFKRTKSFFFFVLLIYFVILLTLKRTQRKNSWEKTARIHYDIAIKI